MHTNTSHSSSIRKLLIALALGATSAVAFAADAAVDRSDKEFITDTYENGLREVKIGELAQAKTANADVKALAGHIVTDHGKANAELKTLADNKKVEVPTDLTLLAKGKVKLLDAKSGADFDQAFVEAMVDGHKKSVKAFEKASSEAKDADVKAWAAKTLPTLKTHLSMAEDVQKKVGK